FFDAYRRVGTGEDGGPLGLLPPSERFHWLTAPRSSALQTSPVHTGRARHLGATLDRLYAEHVAPRAPCTSGSFENGMGTDPRRLRPSDRAPGLPAPRAPAPPASPVHTGRARHPAATLDRLYAEHVAPRAP